MPNLSFLHVSLNRDTPEGREIYDHLAQVPARQRSMVIRAALLAYFKGDGNSARRCHKVVPKTKLVELEPDKEKKPAKQTTLKAAHSKQAMAEDADPGRQAAGSQQLETKASNTENRLKDLLNLIQ